MSKFSGLLGGVGAGGIAVGAAAVLVTGVGVYFGGLWTDQAEEPTPAPTVIAVQPAAPSEAAPAPQEEPVAETQAEPQGEPKTELQAEQKSNVDDSPEPAASTPKAVAELRFDIVRIAPGGQLTLAGRAAPLAALELLLDGALLGELTVGADGSFAYLGDVAPSGTARVLSLRQKDSDGAPAEFLVAPVAAAVATLESPKVEDSVASDAVATTVETTPESPVSGESETVQVIAQITDGSVEIVQPSAATPLADGLALDVISYTGEGEVALSGRALNEGFVRIYLDNKPVATRPVEVDGKWRSELPDVDAGIYTLRVDKVDASGVVTERVETPFKREAPEAVKVTAQAPQVRAVTVQPGATLWAIARERFGDGMLYVQLYEANKDQIRDPDLIYPGQVFDIPE